MIVLKGMVTTRVIEEEFKRIFPKNWRWTAKRVADNLFTVRIPSAQTIKDWEVFNPISMRNVKAKIKVDPWSVVIGAKAKLQMAWFRVRGVPYDKRSKLTLAYVGSLVGATKEIDESSLHMADYVRIKIAAREVANVPEVFEGVILPYLYDFYFDREMEWNVAAKSGTSVKISGYKGSDN
jgi:hypothetical protein